MRQSSICGIDVDLGAQWLHGEVSEPQPRGVDPAHSHTRAHQLRLWVTMLGSQDDSCLWDLWSVEGWSSVELGSWPSHLYAPDLPGGPFTARILNPQPTRPQPSTATHTTIATVPGFERPALYPRDDADDNAAAPAAVRDAQEP